MTTDEIVSLVAYRLGNLRGMDSVIKAEVFQAINRLESREFHPWFLLSENNFYMTQTQENRVPIPKGFLMEYEEGALYLTREGSAPRILEKLSLDQIPEERYRTGAPLCYSLTGSYFRLFPIPDKQYRLEMIFYRKSSTLRPADEDNVWFEEAPELVVAETCWSMSKARRRDDADYWLGVVDMEFKRLLAKDIERRETNRDVTFGGY